MHAAKKTPSRVYESEYDEQVFRKFFVRREGRINSPFFYESLFMRDGYSYFENILQPSFCEKKYIGPDSFKKIIFP